MRGVAKPGAGPFELAAPLDIDVEGPVHQDVGDRVVLEERFERSQTDHVVGQLAGERAFLDLVELAPLLGQDFADDLRDFGPQCRSRDIAGHGRVDPRHQRGPDLLLELGAIGRNGDGVGLRGPVGNENELAAGHFGDAAPKAG